MRAKAVGLGDIRNFDSVCVGTMIVISYRFYCYNPLDQSIASPYHPFRAAIL